MTEIPGLQRFGVFPARMILDRRLKLTDFRLFLALLGFRNRASGLAWPATATLAAILEWGGVHARDDVQKALRRLVDLGYLTRSIRVTRRTGEARAIYGFPDFPIPGSLDGPAVTAVRVPVDGEIAGDVTGLATPGTDPAADAQPGLATPGTPGSAGGGGPPPILKKKKITPKDTGPGAGEPVVAKGTRIPVDWQPGPDEVQFATALGLDVPALRDEFVDYWIGRAGKEGLKASWPATWRNRCRVKAEDAKRRGVRAPILDAIAARDQDPVGIDAWCADLGRSAVDGVRLEDDAKGGPAWVVFDGYRVGPAARAIAAAAKLPPGWRGRWEPLLVWLREVPPDNPLQSLVEDVLVPRIAAVAARPGYRAPGSLMFFDAVVRGHGAQRRGLED